MIASVIFTLIVNQVHEIIQKPAAHTFCKFLKKNL